jgi:hypothetical protein
MKKFISVATSVVLLGIATSSAADPGSHPTPMLQGVDSVKKNLQKNPDNRGLNNALEHLRKNQVRFSEKRGGSHRTERAQRAERVNRPERAERVERVERPERVERVERPERVERVDRPDRPGRR